MALSVVPWALRGGTVSAVQLVWRGTRRTRCRVSVGHVLNYLPDEQSLERALLAVARAVRAGGVIAFDLCDFEYGARRAEAGNLGLVDDEWAIVARFSLPTPDHFIRDITTFCASPITHGAETTSATTTC